MNSKTLTLLAGAAIVLGGAAYFLNRDSKPAASRLNGQSVLPDLSVADVARIEIGGRLTLAAGADGWKIESLAGYPADRAKIAENLLKLAELKVGQVAHGRALGPETSVILKDGSGRTLADLRLGDKHTHKAKGPMAMYGGGYADGRYLAHAGETVLVTDALEAFDGDVKRWCSTRIASVPSADVTAVTFARGADVASFAKGTNSTWVLEGLAANEELDGSKIHSIDSALAYLDFTSVADSTLTEADLGFATGAVYTVTYREGSNSVSRVATVGNRVKDGTDRYFKIDNAKWVYTISSYAADNLTKTRADFVKAKAEPKKDESPKPTSGN